VTGPRAANPLLVTHATPGYRQSMSDDAFAETLPAVAAGRAAAVAQLRDLATRLEQLPLDAVAEVLVLLEPTLDDLRRQATFALERAPAVRL
jgi:hypothetical protein